MFRRTALVTAATLVAVGLAVTGCSSGAGPVTSAGSGAAPASAAPAPQGPGLNTPVKAGTFEYTALGVSDVGTTVGTSPLSQTAQGTFLEVSMKIANTCDSGSTFIVNYVKLVDAAGKTYDADPSATLYASPDQNAWVASINPGNFIQGPIVFDVPVGTQAAGVQVSDSLFSPGQTIALG